MKSNGSTIYFNYFCIQKSYILSIHIKNKKKRYAYLVLENVGNFQIGYKDSIVVLTHIAWAAITAFVCKGYSYDKINTDTVRSAAMDDL